LTQDLSDDELRTIIVELDAEWAPLVGASIRISGKMTFPVSKPDANAGDDSELMVETAYYRNQAVGTRGFLIQKLDTPLDDEHLNTFLYKIVLSVEREITGDEKLHENFTSCYGIADIDEISLNSDKMSPDRARAWFAYFHPQLMEEIDERLLNGSGDEAEATMRLNGISEYLLDESSRHNSKVARDIYLNELLQYDHDSPYSCVVVGECKIIDDEGDTREVCFEKSTFLSRVAFVSMECVTEDAMFVPYVALTVITPDRTEKGVSMMIPLSNMLELTSMRSAYYSNYNSVES